MAESASPARERRQRTWRRRVRKELARALMKIGAHTIPYVYLAYMWLVYRTSRVEDVGYRPDLVRAERGGGVFALWHDEVFFVAWAFGRFRPDTLASQGDSGEIITRMLRLCGFNVFRGGSSSSRARRAVEVLDDMVLHMKRTPGVLYGITTDGSKGPVYRMKKGVVTLAVGGGSELYAEKTWCRRYFRLPTWDGTLVPLPFNHIVHVYAGPVVPPPDAGRPERFEALADEIEGLLCRVTAHARRLAEGEPPDAWFERFPERHRAMMRRPEPPELVLCERPRT